MFEVLHGKANDYSVAYEWLLEFLVADHLPSMVHQFDGKLEWLLKDEALYAQVVSIYKEGFEAIHADGYDYLGDGYVELQGRFSQGIKGQFLTPPHICAMMAQMTLFSIGSKKPVTVLDPFVGTGRMLIAAHKHAPKGSVFYGVDIDNRAIRTACVHERLHPQDSCPAPLREQFDPRNRSPNRGRPPQLGILQPVAIPLLRTERLS